MEQTPKAPERILQFGTGVLLRGLVDLILDKANKAGVYRGSVVMVKTTGGDVSDFAAQDNVYTVYERGISNGILIDKINTINVISRVLSTDRHWQEILDSAANPEVNCIISNATEAGLEYHEEDDILNIKPKTFPAILTACLYHRFKNKSGKIYVLPTELLVNNGQVLKSLVLKHASKFIDNSFEAWLDTYVVFCSTLVDKIVPGKPTEEEKIKVKEFLGFEDMIAVKAEPYALWAIEGKNLSKDLGFTAYDEAGVILSPNIEKYRELKLRLLNAPHTLMSGLCFLSGHKLVNASLKNDFTLKYLENLMLTECIPSINLPNLDDKVKQRYMSEVLDRFSNPMIDHQWSSICVQYSLKFKSRIIPLIENYIDKFDSLPFYMLRCFAAYFVYMKGVKQADGTYMGLNNEISYLIQCDKVAHFNTILEEYTDLNVAIKRVLSEIMASEKLASNNLLVENTANFIRSIEIFGINDALSSLNVFA
jgi:tagaturonate reductase